VAGRAFVTTLVAVSTVVAALAIWKLKTLVALLFLGMILAAAMRPGVEALARRRVPRSVGVLIHYGCFALVLAAVLWFVVPTSLHQLQAAVGNVPTTRGELKTAVNNSSGVKHEILVAVQHRLQRAPTVSALVHPAIDLTRRGLEILAGVFFVFAVGAYWIFERERALGVVVSLVPRGKRRVVRQTWQLVDLRLGAYVRGVILLVCFVSTVFWAIGLPYWLLLGIFAGLVEIIPIIGPFMAAATAVGVGFTVSIHTAILAAVAVLGLRLLQDYVINPRVLGHAVGITPLTVLVAVSIAGFLLGPAWVPLATPFAALVATLVDVFVRNRDPAEEDVPAVLFTGQDVEPARARERA
jgi:predicted PurR-regulated permease PerM